MRSKLKEVKVLIVDDHPLFCIGIRHILQTKNAISQVDEASDGLDALKKLRKSSVPYDLVILDIQLPEQSGLEILKQIKAHRPAQRVLVVSIHSERYYAVRCLRSGASGYLTKQASATDIEKAVQTILDGNRYITPEVADLLTTDLVSPKSDLPHHERLSDREMEVLGHIGSGSSISAIAEKLNLSVKTISTYRSRLLVKLNLKTKGELIRYALEQGIVPGPTTPEPTDRRSEPAHPRPKGET